MIYQFYKNEKRRLLYFSVVQEKQKHHFVNRYTKQILMFHYIQDIYLYLCLHRKKHFKIR